MISKSIIVATRNSGKLAEIKAILQPIQLEIKSIFDFSNLPEVLENGSTFEENALKKAREIFNYTRMPTLADDSGLEVYSLNMQPGVFSARFAGDKVSYKANNERLLSMLSNKLGEERLARFRCVAAFVDDSVQYLTEGICEGRIGLKEVGHNGFGYDPLFIPKGFDETFAELPVSIKNRISHRAIAFSKMKVIIENYFFPKQLL